MGLIQVLLPSNIVFSNPLLSIISVVGVSINTHEFINKFSLNSAGLPCTVIILFVFGISLLNIPVPEFKMNGAERNPNPNQKLLL